MPEKWKINKIEYKATEININKFIFRRILIFTLLAMMIINGANASILTVCSSGCDYNKIQNAINTAGSGDIIEVKSGTYVENVVINKDGLTLHGINSPVVKAKGDMDTAISISAENTKLEGFTVSNSFTGIYLQNSEENLLNNNIIIQNIYGIQLYKSNKNILIANQAEKNYEGYDLWMSNENTLKGNIAKQNDYGIVFSNSMNNDLYQNDFDRNTKNVILYSDKSNTWSFNSKGNYYSDYDESSEGCVDMDGNNICDNPRTITEINIDQYPLVKREVWAAATPPPISEKNVVEKSKGKTVKFKTDKGSIATLESIDENTIGNIPEGKSSLYGVFRFKIDDVNKGDSITIILTFPEALPEGTQYWKYGPTKDNSANHWYSIESNVNGNTLTFSLTDGEDGDDDLQPNGEILDDGLITGPIVLSGSTGSASVPEFPTIAVPVLSVIGILYVMNRRK
jgi:parallel beta-helix repeat protein